MSEGRASEQWACWSELLALTFNVHRNPKKTKPITSAKINPYSRATREQTKTDVRSWVGAMKLRFNRLGK